MKYFSYILAFFIFIASLEFSARVDDFISWDAPFIGSYTSMNLRMRDHLGARCKPNSQFEKWKINSDGFRGEDIKTSPPSHNLPRAIVVGASESFGLYESPGMEFPAQLQLLMKDQYQILNGSCPGMTLRTITQYFTNVLRKYKPEVIIIYPTPHLYLDEDIKAKPPEKNINTSIKPTHTSIETPYKFNSRLTSKIYNLAKKLTPEIIITSLKKYKIYKSTSSHDNNWLWENTPQERLTIFKAQFKTLIENIQRENISIILATHASRFNHTSSDAEQALLTLRNFYPRATNNALLNLEKDANIFIKSFEIKNNIWISDIDQKVSGQRENFIDFSHFSDHGAYLVSKTLAETLHRINIEKKSKSNFGSAPYLNENIYSQSKVTSASEFK